MSTDMLVRPPVATADESQAETKPIEPLSEWLHRDPLEEVIEKLEALGRTPEASLVRALLKDGQALEDDLLMRTLASMRWADDWNNEDDAAYDLL